jgi:hypothetical protein
MLSSSAPVVNQNAGQNLGSAALPGRRSAMPSTNAVTPASA